MIIGTVFTLFVVPSIYVLVARTRTAAVPAAEAEALGAGRGDRVRGGGYRRRGRRARRAAGRGDHRLGGVRAREALQHQRRWLVLDQVLELRPELLGREPAGGGEVRQLVRILEVVAAQADHVAAGDRVARGVDVDHAHPGAARLRVEQLRRTGWARSARPAMETIDARCRRRSGTWPRSSRGRACTPCRTGSGRRSAARSRCSWTRSWS